MSRLLFLVQPFFLCRGIRHVKWFGGCKNSGATKRSLTVLSIDVDDERQLVEGALRGQPAPFVTLVRRYQGLVFHVVGGFVDNPADQEELCQEVFLRVHQKLHTFEHGSLKAWIARVARNVTLNHIRKRAVTEEKFTDSLSSAKHESTDIAATDSAAAESRLITHQVLRFVDELPEPGRDIVRLYYLEEMSIAEIGAILLMPSGTVKSHLFRARQMLKRRIE
jgi:RNA polymerase sigma-70 factor (ECF subfamily)